MIDRYRVELSAAAAKDLKAYRSAAAKIFESLAELESDPERGHALTGNLTGIRSLDITVRGSGEFRAAYEINDMERICLVIAIGPRERFYERLRRRVNG